MMKSALSSSVTTLTLASSLCLLLAEIHYSFATEGGTKTQENLGHIMLEDSTRSVKLDQKSPKGAMFRSLVFPGWGQWYNQQKIKAALALSLQAFLIGRSIHYNNQARKSEKGSQDELLFVDKRNQAYWLIAGATLLSMLDAYIDAHLFGFDTGPDLGLRVGALSNGKRSNSIFGMSVNIRF